MSENGNRLLEGEPVSGLDLALVFVPFSLGSPLLADRRDGGCIVNMGLASEIFRCVHYPRAVFLMTRVRIARVRTWYAD